MAKFRFKMQSVLDIQARREEAAQAELAARERQRAAEQERLDNLGRRRAEAEELARAGSHGPASAASLKNASRRLDAIACHIHDQRAKLQTAETKKEESRRRLVEIGQRRQMYETLREHAAEEHHQNERHADTAAMDEISSRRSAVRAARRS